MLTFIVNPTAGSGRAVARLKEIESILSGGYKVLTTNAPIHAKKLAHDAIAAGASTIVSIGGDGTIQEVISGMINSNVKFGVIPSGSGNDFIKSMGIKDKLSTPEYIDIIKKGKSKLIDAIQMTTETSNYFYVNIGSVGIDAAIASDAVKYKKRFGKLAYVASTLENTMTYSPSQMKITIDGREMNDTYTLAAVCNGCAYGGGYMIAPQAKNEDGLITVCLIKKLSKLAMTALFPTILMGKHHRLKEVEFINCKEINIQYSGRQKVNIDGNILNLESPLHFKLIEKAINIIS